MTGTGLPASLPAEVVEFVMGLTAKDPVWRPASAGEVTYQAQRLRDRLLGHDRRTAGPRRSQGSKSLYEDNPERDRRWLRGIWTGRAHVDRS